MSNKKIVGILLATLAVAGVVVIYFVFGRGGVKNSNDYLKEGITRTSVSPGTTVPDVNSKVSGDTAKPQFVTASGPSASSQLRTFNVSVAGGKFEQPVFNVYVGDTLALNITATDGDYDFYQPDYSLFSLLPKGVSKVVKFQANAKGKYTFYCKSCGGPKNGPVGYFNIVPK